jgi:hypothetical protein
MSSLYAATRQRMVTGAFTWAAGTYSLYMVSGAYAPDYEADTTLSSVPGGVRMAGPFPLANPVASAGWCSVDTLVLANVTTTDVVAGVVIVDGSSNLVAHITDGFGIQYEADTVVIEWDALGVFRA